MKAQRGRRGISVPWCWMEGGWSMPRPGCFTPGKETRYPLYRRLGGPQGRSGPVRKISPHRDCPARRQSLYRLRYPAMAGSTKFKSQPTPTSFTALFPRKMLRYPGCLQHSFQDHVHFRWRVLSFIYRCPRRNGQNFGRVFLMLNYTDITQNTYIQS